MVGRCRLSDTSRRSYAGAVGNSTGLPNKAAAGLEAAVAPDETVRYTAVGCHLDRRGTPYVVVLTDRRVLVIPNGRGRLDQADLDSVMSTHLRPSVLKPGAASVGIVGEHTVDEFAVASADDAEMLVALLRDDLSRRRPWHEGDPWWARTDLDIALVLPRSNYRSGPAGFEGLMVNFALYNNGVHFEPRRRGYDTLVIPWAEVRGMRIQSSADAGRPARGADRLLNPSATRPGSWMVIEGPRGLHVLDVDDLSVETLHTRARRALAGVPVTVDVAEAGTTVPDDLAGQLERLTALFQTGALDESEFRAAKRRLLEGG